MSEDKEWWEYYYEQGLMTDGYNIPAILAEHTRRIVEVLEGMKNNGGGSYEVGWDAALDGAITKIKEI